MRTRLAIVGTGYIGTIHGTAVSKLPDAELVAAVDPNAETLQRFGTRFEIPHLYATLEALQEQISVDAIVVATPNRYHAPLAIQALKAGIHVFVEKPMAIDAKEAEQMIAASEVTGAKLMVGHCWRFDEEVLWLKRHVDGGRLGRIIRTKGYGVHSYWGPKGWFTQKHLAGGGALVDMGIHALDTARFLLGDPSPRRVYAHIGTYYGDYDVDDTGIIIVQWDNGAVSYIEAGWWQPHTDGPEAATQLYGAAGFGSVFPTRLEIPDYEQGKVEVVEGGFPFPRKEHCAQAMYDRQMAYFVNCIREGCTPVPGGNEGWINMKVLDAAYGSARSGKVVEVR